MQPNCSKSTESLYSTTSSKYSAGAVYTRQSNLHLRKATANNLGSRSGEIRQRVLSARRIRMKTLQNQLADAQHHIAELAQENRILRTLHKRQDNALTKYESTSAELPQLLHSHAEEIRICQTKYKTLQNKNKELTARLKLKDGIILNLSDQNKHLTYLNNDKNLEDRERLTERVRYLEQKLNEKDTEMKLMIRKLQLEKKSLRNQLQTECSKNKDLMLRLEKTKSELTGLSKLDPLGIADKLAKVSLFPKPIRGRTKNALETSDGESTLRTSVVRAQHNMGAENDPKMFDEKTALKNMFSRNRSISPKSEEEVNLKTPSPITMRRKSSADRNLTSEKGQRKTLPNYYEMNDISGENDSDEIADGRASLTDLTKWNLNSNEQIHVTKFEELKYEQSYGDLNDEESNDKLEDHGFSDRTDMIETPKDFQRTEDDFADIKKQITNDYQDRENFLDTFCRDSSTEALSVNFKEDYRKHTNTNIDSKKKKKLLAALKEIDGVGSRDCT